MNDVFSHSQFFFFLEGGGGGGGDFTGFPMSNDDPCRSSCPCIINREEVFGCTNSAVKTPCSIFLSDLASIKFSANIYFLTVLWKLEKILFILSF